MTPASTTQWAEFYSAHVGKFRKLNEKQAEALCPFHDDIRKPSLSIALMDGLFKCHGCGKEGNGVTFADLRGINRESLPGWEPARPKQSIEATYDYTDEAGSLLYQVVRLFPKSFRQRVRDQNGVWVWGLNGARRVLYHLPEILNERIGRGTVYIVEGERDCDVLRGAGFASTCNPMGAGPGKWLESYSKTLDGFAEAVIVADKDTPGRDHAKRVAESLSKYISQIRVLELPGDRVKDSADWFEQGGEVEAFKGLVAQAPIWSRENSFLFSAPKGEETEKNSKRLGSVTLGELLSAGDVEIDWKIKDLLPMESVGILSGTSGHGKSWMLMDLAIEASRGGKWLGQFATKPGRVVYIDEESSSGLLIKRMNKLLRAKGLKAEDTDIRLVIGKGLCFSDPGSVQKLMAELDDLRPSLVIIDALIRVFKGEENSASEMAGVFNEVKKIVRDYKCAILFADHQKKVSMPGGTGDQLLRGSSEKTAFVDTLLSLQRKEDTLFIEHSKSRFAEPVPAFAVKIEDNHDKTHTTVRYVGDAEPLRQAARLEPAFEFLAGQFIGDQWLSRQDLVDRGKEKEIQAKLIDDALQALYEQGKLEKDRRKPEAGPGGARVFFRNKTDQSEPNNTFLFSAPIVEKREMNSQSVPAALQSLMDIFPGATIRPQESLPTNG